ncbi:MAG TPA: TMEM165/GDT1 family protein [Mycobacteriales bacterium]|jgi:putative Ca2+/H+ antiporter (TMEM165/GDT1 family)|nr:TMEM165/GDT1 family protein [Mycobacteriales bacterium]
MSFTVAITVFALILPAELPDKTFIASLVLATRFRAVPVVIGAALGFAVQCVIAVAAGSAVALLPTTLVHAVSAAMFAIGAVLMLRSERDPKGEERKVEAEIADVVAAPSNRRVILTSFLVLFLAEWGDLTQLLTASLSAKYHQPIAVFAGSWLALVAVASLAVTGGKALLRVISLEWVRRIAAVAFAAVAIVTALEAADVL